MTMLQFDVSSGSTVFLVDDDDGVRSALRFLLESEELTVRAYSCPEGRLTEGGTCPDGCPVTDYNMPGEWSRTRIRKSEERRLDAGNPGDQ